MPSLIDEFEDSDQACEEALTWVMGLCYDLMISSG
jgi:hypothetical protein